MLNYLHEMSREDILRSFADTYIAVYVEGQGRRSAYVIGAESDRLECRIGKNTVMVPYSDVDLEQPDLGMMWYNGTLYYISRNPDRQWRRGLRARGLSVYILGPDGSSVLQQPSNNLLAKIARYFIEGSSTNENIISRDFARRGKYLFFRSIPVGTVYKDVVSMGYDIDLTEYLEGHLNANNS